MKNACIIGASGYSGAELARLLSFHPDVNLKKLFVSENSQDSGKTLQQLYAHFPSQTNLPLQQLTESELAPLANEMDYIFLATPHEVSARWLPELANKKAIVLDLSGAHRFSDSNIYAKYYGFQHQTDALINQAVYGLVDWSPETIACGRVIAVPGCYATASLLALKPLTELLDPQQYPVISAVSGMSGAGRKAGINNSFCEVSLQAYGLLSHRHAPEIATYLGQPVIFTPHIAPFKRGILATCTVKLAAGISLQQVEQAYEQAYGDLPLVRLRDTSPKLEDVVNSSRCDLHWKLDEDSQYLVVVSAIDNLLKGAAGQAVQCMNLTLGLGQASHKGLLNQTGGGL